MTIEDFLKLLQGQAALLTVAVIILYGGAKGIWVWGYQFNELRKDRDEWKERALRGIGLVERTVTIVENQTQSSK